MALRGLHCGELNNGRLISRRTFLKVGRILAREIHSSLPSSRVPLQTVSLMQLAALTKRKQPFQTKRNPGWCLRVTTLPQPDILIWSSFSLVFATFLLCSRRAEAKQDFQLSQSIETFSKDSTHASLKGLLCGDSSPLLTPITRAVGILIRPTVKGI